MGSYVVVDMGTVQTFNQIFASANHNALQDYKIFVSDDGANWGEAISSGSIVPTGGYNFAPFNFPVQTKRYFKIESQYDSQGRYWGFWNISALNSPAVAAPGENIALNKSTAGSTVANPAAVFDGNDATGIDDASVIAVDLGSPYAISGINVKFGSTEGGFAYRIETSNDNAAWTLRQSVFLTHDFSRVFTNQVLANYTCRFLRFSFDTSHPHNVDVKQHVNEIEVYKTAAP